MKRSSGARGSGGSALSGMPAQVLRNGGSVTMGAVGAAALVFVAVTAWPRHSWLGGVAVLGAVSCHLVLIYPVVRVDSGGVFLANPLRWVWVPWPAVEATGWRWSLEVYAEGRTFAAWALAAKVDRIRLRDGGTMGTPRASAGSPADHARSGTGPMTAQRGAAIIDQAQADWRDRVAGSGVRRATRAPDVTTDGRGTSAGTAPGAPTAVDCGWHLLNVGLLGVGVAAVVVGSFTG